MAESIFLEKNKIGILLLLPYVLIVYSYPQTSSGHSFSLIQADKSKDTDLILDENNNAGSTTFEGKLLPLFPRIVRRNSDMKQNRINEKNLDEDDLVTAERNFLVYFPRKERRIQRDSENSRRKRQISFLDYFPRRIPQRNPNVRKKKRKYFVILTP